MLLLRFMVYEYQYTMSYINLNIFNKETLIDFTLINITNNINLHVFN